MGLTSTMVSTATDARSGPVAIQAPQCAQLNRETVGRRVELEPVDWPCSAQLLGVPGRGEFNDGSPNSKLAGSDLADSRRYRGVKDSGVRDRGITAIVRGRAGRGRAPSDR